MFQLLQMPPWLPHNLHEPQELGIAGLITRRGCRIGRICPFDHDRAGHCGGIVGVHTGADTGADRRAARADLIAKWHLYGQIEHIGKYLCPYRAARAAADQARRVAVGPQAK